MGTAHAVPLYWDISAANNLTAGAGTWGTDAFWAASSAPLLVAPGPWTDGSDAYFQTAGTNTVAIAVAGVSANSVTQTTNSTATTISNTGGGTLSITGTGGIVNTGNTTFTINAPVNLNGAATYTFQSNSTITMGGAIGETGTAGISKTGNSVLNLNAANSFSGGITISAGRISVGAAGSLGSNAIGNSVAVSAGANLALAAAANIGASQTVSISSSATALGGIGVGYAGSLPTLDTTGTGSDGGVFGINFTGTAGFSSLATLDTTLNASGGTGHWYLGSQSGGTFDGATLAAASDNIYRLGGGGGTLTFSQPNVITGANDLQIGASLTNGGGTVVLGAAQNHTGATTVSGGTLKLGNAGALGDLTTHTTGLTVNGSGIFDFAGFAPTYSTLPIILNSTANGFDVGAFTNSGAAVIFGGTVELQRQTRIGGTGGITLTGTITGGGFNLIKDSTSTLILSTSGTVALGALQSNRGTIQVDPGTTLNVTSIDIGIGNSVGAGLTLNGGSVTSSGTSRFGQGSGTASGTLTLNSGTLTVPALTKGTLTFNANFNGGTLKARSSSSNFLTATVANVKDGGAIIDSNSFDITIPQALVRFAGATTDKLTKNGNGFLTLSGTNTYGGGTDVNTGGLTYLNTNAKPLGGITTVAANTTLGLGVATSGTFFTSGDVDSLFAGTLAGVTNSATSNVGIDTAAASFTYASSIPANTKGLVKLGANTLTLTGTNAYTGGTTVHGGALTLLGDQTGATGGFAVDITNLVASTLNIGSGSQTVTTSASASSGKTVQLGAIGSGSLGTAFQSLTVNGASGFLTTMTNDGTLGVGRNSTMTVNNYATWTQNGSMNIQAYGGYAAQLTVNAGGSFIYAGATPIDISSLSGTSATTRLYVNGGSLTTNQPINFNGNSGNVTGVASFVLYGNGTLKLSASIADLVTGDSGGLVYFANGGSVIDTNGFNTTLSRSVTDLPSNVGSLTKEGLGTLTISGSAGYTGDTTVAKGTLEVTGSLGATAVTVQNNATLAGSGDLGGDVTIESGGHHALAVAATTGAQVTRTIAGVLDLTAVGNILDLTAASTPAAGGPYVLVTATGGITGGPTTVNLSGLTGTVAVNGNNLELTVTTPPAGYTSWIGGFGLAAGDKDPLDDPDNDGMENALEYVLNGNPSASDPSKLPTLAVTATDFVFSFTRRAESATDTTQVFQYGSNLTGWTPLNITTPTASQVALGTPSGGLQSVIVTIPKTLASGGKLFGRLQVVK
jgi:autotransporter-associated beta strand protein